MLALDWNEPDEFLHALQAQLARTEPPDLVIAWIHDDDLAMRFATGLTEATCHFFHVVGSAAADPPQIAASLMGRVQLLNVVYHHVILGYVDADQGTRWLTNDEISAGVLAALARARPKHIVGTIQPWEFRPC